MTSEFPAFAGVIVLQGIFDPDGQNLRDFKSVRFYGRRFMPDSYQPAGYFNIEVHYVNGETTYHPFDALVASDSAADSPIHGFFEVEVPVDGKVDFVRITDRQGDHVFAEVTAADILR